MKKKNVVQILGVLLVVMLVCSLIPSAWAEGGDAEAATREQKLLDYLACVMAVDKAETQAEQEALLAQTEMLWDAYSAQLRGQWKSEEAIPAAAEPVIAAEPAAELAGSEQELEMLRNELLTYYILYMNTAQTEKDPYVRTALYADADAIWDAYISLVMDAQIPETAKVAAAAKPVAAEPVLAADPAAEQELEELRSELLTYYFLYMDAIYNAKDPNVQAALNEEADAIWDAYMSLVFDAQGKAPAKETAVEPPVSTEELEELRSELLTYYLLYVDSAEVEQNPFVRKALLADADAIWDAYMDLVFYQKENEAHKADVYLDDPYLYSDPADAGKLQQPAAADPYMDKPAADEQQEAAPVIGLPNPWVETDSLEEAVQISGISLDPPVAAALPRDMELQRYRALDGTIEADYSNGEEALVIRASVDDKGYILSGDYHKYSKEWAENVKGLRVDCLGDGEKINVACFTRGDVAFSVTSALGHEGAGLTVGELKSLILGMQARPVLRDNAPIPGSADTQDAAEAPQSTEEAVPTEEGSFVVHYTYTYTDENGTVEKSGVLTLPADSAAQSDLEGLLQEALTAPEAAPAPAAAEEPAAAEKPAAAEEPAVTEEPASVEELAAPAEPAEAEAAEESAVVTSTEYTLAVYDPFAVDADGKAVRLVRIGETNLGDLCADAFRAQGRADIGLIDAGAICADIAMGEITEANIREVLPYGDELCVIAASGQQILDALEWGSRAIPNEFGGFLQTSGLSYEIHSYIDSGCTVNGSGEFTGVDGERRVKNVKVGGEALDPEKIYLVAGPNFILLENGGGNTAFQGAILIRDHLKVDTQVLIDYLIDDLHGTIGETYADPYGEGRIVIYDVAPAEAAPAAEAPAEAAPAAEAPAEQAVKAA